MPNLKNGSLVRPSDLSVTKWSNSVFRHFANRAVVGISWGGSYGLWFVLQGVLRLGAMPYTHFFFTVFTQKIYTTCRNVPTFEVGAAYLSLLLTYSLSGHRQRRQRKRHHPLDRLRTSSSVFQKQIRHKNESCMFIICDQHCPELHWDGLKSSLQEICDGKSKYFHWHAPSRASEWLRLSD